MTSDARQVRLASWPTPLEPAPRLARAIGLEADDLWLKRDDLVGLGGGGNKVRKLEWIVGAALEDDADVLVTTGAAQSNHARLTAAAGARLGLDVVLVLKGEAGRGSSGNLALDGLLGARVVWAGDTDNAGMADAADQVVADLVRDGRRPALVPFGGSSALGARGYRECADELLAQAPDLRTVVTAAGSGGTMAGLVAGLGDDRVLGVHVGAVADPARTVADLVVELTGADCDPHGLRLRLDQVGGGYATLPEPVVAALATTARTEGVVLDPVYTGRAMAGLVAAVEAGDVRPGERTVFLHTGGLPGLFGSAAAVLRAEAMLR
ncbi:D-cysteine desulfhydrase family protein [Blastococcus sp. TF02-8]|uniref:1-aminocyclopropane-1-carboxylate deaminase/D-cysteine desulfhydrase n=1 Tax=Blastococcus sp. TF02-8 TaxID=2250574 RepID=UPI000DEB926E|nr:pyridoxal-phosphate dependent enzyme [Blastococcus sp. TF02-8]RBY98035.1 D-cysteine desulfhydrase family protein [Blastococcus sp. TF02-8]